MSDFDLTELSNEVTRRQWLLRLGEIVALAGVSGLIPEAMLLQAQANQPALPPGLYSPSADDLVHALSMHKLVVPPPGSETDYAHPASSPFEPQFFTEQEFHIVTRFAEIILGNVDADALSQTVQWIDLWFQSSAKVRAAAQQLDPQHRALAVAFFGEASVRELETTDPAAVSREGLSSSNRLVFEKYQKGFLDLDAAEQTEIVRAIATGEPDNSPTKFYKLVRDETIRGYYTSAAGLKELNYQGNAYHPSCPGCDALAAGTATTHE